ncbi:MAG: hypothetical protein LBF97_07535, partial [Elusimicrobiota bacterium]|nr:hypothetical protein [Elusimicrobiota bacterium]
VLRNLALMPYTATNFKPRVPRKTYNPNFVKQYNNINSPIQEPNQTIQQENENTQIQENS